jgi:hypothetical protein
VACALILGAAASSLAREVLPPEQITVGRSKPLRLWSQAHRADRLGTVDLYTVALYGDGAVDFARLASPDVAKAVRIDVTYRLDLQRPIAVDWRRELIPRLESHAVAHLSGSFAPLRHGDVVQVEYVPQSGTIVRVNEGVAVPSAHHDLILAFLEHWIGDRPVSEAMKRALLRLS